MRCDTKLVQVTTDAYLDQIRLSLCKVFKLAITKNFLLTVSKGITILHIDQTTRNACVCSLFYMGEEQNSLIETESIVKKEIEEETGFQIYRSSILKFLSGSRQTQSKTYIDTDPNSILFSKDVLSGPFNKTINISVFSQL